MNIDIERTAIVGLICVALIAALLLIIKWPRGRATQDGEDEAGRSRNRIQIIAILASAFALLLAAHYVVKNGVFHTALHEVGFALLVSLVVWAMFEARLSQDADKAWDRRIDRVTKNVFNAVLRKDLPKELLDEANNLILNSSMVREDFTVTYTLRDASVNGGNLDCVLVDAVMQFTMRNISTDQVTWHACLGLPNPIHDELKALLKVTSLSVIKGGEPLQLEIENAEISFREKLKDNSETEVMYDAGKVTLEKGESLNVSAAYTMAKEAEDTEFLRSLHPANGLRVTIFDQTPGRRLVFAKSVHRHKLNRVSAPDTPGAAQIFNIPGYLLPQQGVLIWWKKAPAAAPVAKAGTK